MLVSGKGGVSGIFVLFRILDRSDDDRNQNAANQGEENDGKNRSRTAKRSSPEGLNFAACRVVRFYWLRCSIVTIHHIKLLEKIFTKMCIFESDSRVLVLLSCVWR